MESINTNNEQSTERIFAVDDLVEYRPYENCDKKDIVKNGKISKVLGKGDYKVLFGDYEKKIQWWSNGTYYWTNLWKQ